MISWPELTALPAPAAAQRISYGKETLQFGELRMPVGSAPVALVVFIHGGCWQAEYNLDHTRPAAAALVREGYAVWSPEYRRVGDAGGGWPGTFEDVGHAVDFVRVIARDNPRIDTTRVIVAGHSAGGQLSLWLASRTEAGAFKPAGVVSLAGITDMAAYGAAPGSCNVAVHPLMGGTPAEHPDRYKAVSPVERVPIPVPVRIVHGERDPIVPLAQSREFVERDRAAGGTVELDVVPGLGHFDLVAPTTTAWPAVVRAIRSLVQP